MLQAECLPILPILSLLVPVEPGLAAHLLRGEPFASSVRAARVRVQVGQAALDHEDAVALLSQRRQEGRQVQRPQELGGGVQRVEVVPAAADLPDRQPVLLPASSPGISAQSRSRNLFAAGRASAGEATYKGCIGAPARLLWYLLRPGEFASECLSYVRNKPGGGGRMPGGCI